jgi:hypothetical protein
MRVIPGVPYGTAVAPAFLKASSTLCWLWFEDETQFCTKIFSNSKALTEIVRAFGDYERIV